MKKMILSLAVAAVALGSCHGSKKESAQVVDSTVPVETLATDTVETAQAPTSIEGTYEGVLPCADCEGIKTTIMLSKDNTYTKTSEYLGKANANKFDETGTVELNGDELTLTSKDGEKTFFKVGEGIITMLDKDKKEIQGELAASYVLKKM